MLNYLVSITFHKGDNVRKKGECAESALVLLTISNKCTEVGMKQSIDKVNNELNNVNNVYNISYEKDGVTVETLINGINTVLNRLDSNASAKRIKSGDEDIFVQNYYHIEENGGKENESTKGYNNGSRRM